MKTFYWHDYETWGINPSLDRPVQFAGVRTDMDLNIVSKPLVIYCKPPKDLLPQPESCLITGITPQMAEERGVLEYQFAAAIHRELSTPDTCALGFNTIRFDDEVTRYLFYRNFYPAYDREFKNNNSRFDILDMVRTAYALRPEDIEWYMTEEGKPSFKLENITRANGLSHENSHDALSDVYATIAVARLFKEKKPKLFDHLFKLRQKCEVLKLVDIHAKKSFLHISGRFSTDHRCAAVVMPLAIHPRNTNEVICFDLSGDPSLLIDLTADEIYQRVFVSNESLKESRIPIKSIKVNRCPVVCDMKMVDEEVASRLKIDKSLCEAHHQMLLKHPELGVKLQTVFQARVLEEVTDTDRMLYSGGFFSEADKAAMLRMTHMDGAALSKGHVVFKDERIKEMLFRYRARNFPAFLSADEVRQWKAFCYARLTDPAAGGSLVMSQFQERLSELESGASLDERKQEIIAQLRAHADDLLRFAR